MSRGFGVRESYEIIRADMLNPEVDVTITGIYPLLDKESHVENYSLC